MFRKKQQAAARQHQDQTVEQLYRTIPGQYGTGRTPSVNPAPEVVSPKPSRWKKVIKRTLLLALVLALIAGVWVGWKFVANGVRVFGWDGFLSLFSNQQLKGEDSGRVNILLAGNSVDDPGHGGAELTDSIMVVSINTKDKTGYLLSIPRDLYVDIPGYGYAKINEAYQNGQEDGFSEGGYAEGGMGLLQKTVTEHFGIDLHYYALVNYGALEQAVNAVGGITITINSSDPRGLYDPSRDLQTGQPIVDLPNGIVTLDGRQALNLARARGNARGSYGFASSDFARTGHQRQILIGLKDKAVSAGTLSNPLKLGELFDSFGSNVSTDLRLGEVRRLYGFVKDIESGNITSASLDDANGEYLLSSYTTVSGQSALVPRAGVDDYTEIQTYIETLHSK